MRFDKLTTKFQQALADAQSMALGNDNGFIEPQHLLSALLEQDDGGTASLLSRAGVAVPRLKQALGKAIDRLPKVEGQGGEISVSRDLNNLLNLDRQGSDQARRPVHRERALPAGARRRQGRDRPPAEGARAHAQGAGDGDRGRARRRAASIRRKPKASARR